jgi:serine/threonine protein kinase
MSLVHNGRARMLAAGEDDRVGQYVLRREIGRGAMGVVYEAEHVGLGKRVALKRMHLHLASDTASAARFLREGRAATQIRSPHVVEVFDVGTHQGVPYLVMELLEGVDLAALLRDEKKLGPTRTADLMIPIASAVFAAHQAGVVHRDLKPSNVLLARRDPSDGALCGISPVILDFGISKLTGEVDHDATASAVLLGTVAYMSPEQTRGGKKASAASDQYALGVMLYECLTGTKPFVGSTPYSIMHAIVSATVSPPSVLDPSLSTALDAVVLRAMHRDPRERFPSVRALEAALLPYASAATRERYARALGIDSPSIVVRSPRGPRRRRRAIWALGVLGVALVAAIGFGARSRRGQERPAHALAPLPVTTPPVPASVLPELRTPDVSASSQPPTAETASAAPVSPPLGTAPPRAPPPSPKGAAAPSRRTERGTNGALIVE